MSIFQTLHSISDQAISWLLCFIGALLQYCGLFSPMLKITAEKFPNTIYLRDKFINTSDHTTVYVCCSSCHELYDHHCCLEKSGTQITPKNCSKVTYSKVCNSTLMKQVISKSGSAKFYPVKTYCYNSLTSALQRLFLRPGFVEMCEKTRNYHSDRSHNRLSDVYHGKIWSEFLKVDQCDFLLSDLCYGVMLNIDWFQPFDHYT